MKSILRFLLLLVLTASLCHGAVTDIYIQQRDTATTFTSRIITGSAHLGEPLVIDPSTGVLGAAILSGTKIGPGINASNITTGVHPVETLPAATTFLGSSIEGSEIADGTIAFVGGGNVGIGTIPNLPFGVGLHIKAPSYVGLALQRGIDASGHMLDFTNAANAVMFRVGTNFASGGDNLLFAYGAPPGSLAIGMMMDTTGKVGIGTIAPTAQLNVESATMIQQAWKYNSGNYATLTVGSSGNTTLDASGFAASINILDPLNVGGELGVGSLTDATIGGASIHTSGGIYAGKKIILDHDAPALDSQTGGLVQNGTSAATSVGIGGGKIYTGGTVSVGGQLSVWDTTVAAAGGGSIQTTGGIYVAKNAIIDSDTSSSGSQTGALVINGTNADTSVGIGGGKIQAGGDVYVGGTFYANLLAVFGSTVSVTGDLSAAKITSSGTTDAGIGTGAIVASAGGIYALKTIWTDGNLVVGGGDPVKNILSASSAIDFASMVASSEDTKTVNVTGVVATNVPSVELGWSAALPDGIVVKQAWVSGVGVVSIRVRNTSASTIDPGGLTVRATVTSFP
jgi:hypothetical protein